MRFADFNRAIDKIMEYGVEEDKAIAIVGDMADIFNIQPEDTLEDLAKEYAFLNIF